ncbi:unnamed protein product (macronuclear) [Paramecium tetraurelia]|uniref:Uncharacterized protein n=1 Tax=Paramecium tetraurelia TaxID=5888 RepID=A0BT96_PARTE|nr:uncharacterized protein GSPATT00031995001 [Paramecium tetraurelia]CAK61763.1 unnamed protein product [Paramecium tetraurelia]|eukprot:XP_001429161.1 hypothetical protein (macronuclear) [Paramecium tetraurelia strain d4-2]
MLDVYQEAIECYNEAISINPKYAQAWNKKGNTLSDLKQYEEAIECYNKAISFNHKYVDAFCNKGFALGNLNQYEEAIVLTLKMLMHGVARVMHYQLILAMQKDQKVAQQFFTFIQDQQ